MNRKAVDFSSIEALLKRCDTGRGRDTVYAYCMKNIQEATADVKVEEIKPTHLKQWYEYFSNKENLEAFNAGEKESLFEMEVEVLLMNACGPKLREVLSGSLDPLGLLVTSGLAENFYKSGYAYKVGSTVIGEVIECFVNQENNTSTDILEVGGGTASTLTTIEGKLNPNKVTYLFTDISAYFVKRARDSFRNRSFVNYAVLDIEREFSSQGVKKKFDVIVAANVLHATSHIGKCLSNISQAMKKSGILILFEPVCVTPLLGVTFSLLKGWWLFKDERRLSHHSPLLTIPMWHEVLFENNLQIVYHCPLGKNDLAIMVIKFREPDE